MMLSREGLVSMRYDGTDRRTHMKITGKKSPLARRAPSAQDARIHPDGRWALTRVNNQLFVAAVPPPTGNPPTLNVSSPAVPVKQLTDVGADSFSWADGGQTVFSTFPMVDSDGCPGICHYAPLGVCIAWFFRFALVMATIAVR